MQAYPRETLRARLLAMTAWFQVKEHSLARLNFVPLYVIIAAVGLLTIAYALLLNRVRNLQFFAYTQLTIDIALATLIVYITGGTESYLHALYPLSVIGASIILGKRGGFYAASVSSIAYGVLIDVDFYRMLPLKYKLISAPYPPAWEDVLMTVSTNILAFFTVAYLTGYLAERTARAERELEEKGIDYERLEALNRQIIENITSGIMTLDGRMRITSFNREAESVTGYTLREVYYREVGEIFPGMLGRGPGQAALGSRLERKFRKKTGEELYLGFTVSGDDKRLMEIILRETDRLNRLITDYLLFAKPAKELRELVDISSIISETIEVFRNCPEASKITIEESVAGSFRMYGDPRQLGQVFWNLFLNAAHAMEDGGTLTVRAEYTRQGKNMLRRVFDPFFSTKDKGTGLGLSIVHRIIESHNGAIEVASSEGRGTVFRILLPIDDHAAMN